MTRWKREFRLWCKREGMRVYAVPRNWKHWDAAKMMTRLFDHQVRSDDFDRAFQTAMLYGGRTVIGGFPPLSTNPSLNA